MGVRGLTTFINSNKSTYFRDYYLHNSVLIVDGNSLAAVLYSQNLGLYSACGGDYDLFAYHIDNFVKNLRKCKVEAIFIFDGGYEAKKAGTVTERNAKKVFVIDKIRPEKPVRDFFPLMLRPVLQEKLIELGITCLQSDFEADREIAAIARRLNAPVLSNDSDFFIFDVLFIPLSTFSFEASFDGKQNYIPCQVFHVENFLQKFGGLDKAKLPLLATILGNDYVKRSEFKNFYGLIKIEKGKKMNLGKRRVAGFVLWLKTESFDSALCKIIASLPKAHRCKVKYHINSIINNYANLTTSLDAYLPTVNTDKRHTLLTDVINDEFKNLSIKDDIDNNSSDNDDEDNIDQELINDNKTLEDSSEESSKEEPTQEVSFSKTFALPKEAIPKWLLERSRRCLMPPQVLTLLTLNTYFFVPQVEDSSLHYAGEIGLPILQIIANIVLGENSSFVCWFRFKSNEYRSERVATVNSLAQAKMPNLVNLNTLSLSKRKTIVLEALNINESFLNNFPEEWHLLIGSIIYWIKKKECLQSHQVHAVVMMIIVVNIYQLNIGVFRKVKLFARKFGSRVEAVEKLRKNVNAKFNGSLKHTFKQLLKNVTLEDCLITFESLFNFFNVDISLKERSRNFTRSLIHSFAELQTVIDLIQTLNSLLLQPYKPIRISKVYNGTFVYNVASNLKRQPDIITYLEKTFKKSPNILNLHMTLYIELSQYIITTPLLTRINNKKRKNKRKKLPNDEPELDENSEDSENFRDENNKFSLLQGNFIYDKNNFR